MHGITNIDSANEFLKTYIQEFNDQFGLPQHGIKSVFEAQPSQEKINTILAVLCERTIDCGHSVKFNKHYYRLLDSEGKQIHFNNGTKVMVIKAYDQNLYCCVNDKDIYCLEEIPEHEKKSKDLDIDYKKPKERKKYIPPMNHPWRKASFQKFVQAQPHRIEEAIAQY